jgi:hypothetical protein
MNKAPYKISFINRIYDWLLELPIPTWTILLAYTLLLAGFQHQAAYEQNLLDTWKFDASIGLTGLFFVSVFMVGQYAFIDSTRVLAKYRPVLDMDEDEFDELKFRFTKMPNGESIVLALAGGVLGYISGIYDVSVSPPLIYAHPPSAFFGWILTFSLSIPLTLHFIRQLRMITNCYARSENIDLFNLGPVYEFSKYAAVVGVYIFFATAGLTIIIKPTTFDSPFVMRQMYFWIVAILVTFFYPTIGINGKLRAKKESLLDNVNQRIKLTLSKMQFSELKRKEIAEVGEIGSVLKGLKDELEILENLRTWPWRPGTVSGLLSALLLPLVIGLIRELLANWVSL